MRKNRIGNLIPDDLVSSALNVYIENALEISKHNSMFDVSKWEKNDDVNHESNEERRLIDIKLNKKVDDGSISNNRSSMSSKEKDKELIDLAEKGQLFHIDLNNVYESVGKTQVENFGRIYGMK